jgi:hypothetical protein
MRMYFQMFDVFNRHGITVPTMQIGSARFGTVMAQDLNGLPGLGVGQFGARFTF